MFKIKIILMLLVLAASAGGYAYVQKLQKDNAILKTNQVKLETAVTESNEVIEQQTNDLKNYLLPITNTFEGAALGAASSCLNSLYDWPMTKTDLG